MPDTPAVQFKNVSKVYPNGTKGVDNVSFTIQPGKIVALLGPSGCGKTTTLRLINRLEKSTGGEVLVRGENVNNQRPEQLRRSIGYVIQEGGLFPHLDVSTNVATVPKLLGWAEQRTRDRVKEVLDLVGLPETQYGKRKPSQLSGGQRQRVGVARGLAADPDILLMDEPFGALDPGTRGTIQDEFLRLQENLHKTVVMVTHDITEAGKMADNIVLMYKGKINQEGTIRDILLQPADQNVREFLGKQGHGLALESLRLEGVLPQLTPLNAGDSSITLSDQTTLGQVLVALSGVPDSDVLTITGAETHPYQVNEVRNHIVADLRLAEKAFDDWTNADISPDPINDQITSSPSEKITK